jgi:hypothetical protein
MWRRCECPRFTFPVPVFLKRLDAPLCVFSFGISPQWRSGVSYQLSALNIYLNVSIKLLWNRGRELWTFSLFDPSAKA